MGRGRTMTRSWDGRDGNGTPAASGVYFYRLVVGSESLTRKLIRVGS